MTSALPVKPKDLGLKVGSKLEVFWTQVRDASKMELAAAEDAVMYQAAVLEMAEEKIVEEKEKHLNT